MTDEQYLKKAIDQAKKASANDEVPIGAIVVDSNGIIIGRGYNKMEKTGCQTGHAEVVAIEKACKKIGDWRLNGCSIYVTLEPCLMCFGLIQLSRIDRLVFGARSPLFGFGYGTEKIPPMGNLTIEEGIRKEECSDLLKKFFKKVRT